MTTNKPKKIPQAAHTALQAVIYRESQIKAYEICVAPIIQDRFVDPSVVAAIHLVRSQMCQSLNEAYQNLLMWLHITPESLPEEVRIAVINQFIGSGKEIMSRLRQDLSLPNSYPSEDREDFRKEIDSWLEENLPKNIVKE